MILVRVSGKLGLTGNQDAYLAARTSACLRFVRGSYLASAIHIAHQGTVFSVVVLRREGGMSLNSSALLNTSGRSV